MISMLLTVEEVAEELRLHPETVRRMLRTGDMPGSKYGDEWRIDRAELDEWKKQRKNRYRRPAQES